MAKKQAGPQGKPYTMKDLGYKRAPTEAWYRVTAEDGRIWEVPVQVIVDSRDENYADEKEDTIGFVRDGSLDASDIVDWAANKMNWSDVAEYAREVPTIQRDPDYQEVWCNGDHKIIGNP